MEYLLLGVLVSCILVGCHGDCVEEKKTDLHVCLDGLAAELRSKKGTETINFLCAPEQKKKLDCITKHFRECPGFESEEFINDLEHTGINFHAKDLFYIKSADQFCKCIPTLSCFEDIEVMMLYKTVDRPTWPKEADPSYICTNGRRDIVCVKKAISTCTEYLQYKYNESMEGAEEEEHFYVGNLSYVGVFENNRCETWPEDKDTHNCTSKRSSWDAIDVCYKGAILIKDENERECGMRKCVERAMFTCPREDMDYFIDAVNTFAPYKIRTTPCELSSAPVTVATLLNILLSVCLILLL